MHWSTGSAPAILSSPRTMGLPAVPGPPGPRAQSERAGIHFGQHRPAAGPPLAEQKTPAGWQTSQRTCQAYQGTECGICPGVRSACAGLHSICRIKTIRLAFLKRPRKASLVYFERRSLSFNSQNPYASLRMFRVSHPRARAQYRQHHSHKQCIQQQRRVSAGQKRKRKRIP